MKRMLKRIGYVNIALLIASTVIIIKYVDFQSPTTIDYVLLALYGTTVLIHFTRLIIFMLPKER